MSVTGERFQLERKGTGYRTEFQVDRDRLLYSPHLARLAEVTQVRTVSDGYLVHNRLTHSLKVAQLARRIAEKLCQTQNDLANRLGLDPDSAEAAGLAHDMGHPPFGHIAEYELNRLVKDRGDIDGYEGNAQTFRIVAKLTIGDSSSASAGATVPGLNLTWRTLNGLLKYPWTAAASIKKWGVYQTERDIFDWARAEAGLAPRIRSVEAEVMDWADDTTYAVHDLVDFYCAGKIPLHLLANLDTGNHLSRRERERFLDKTFDREPELAANRVGCEKALMDAFSLVGSVSSPYMGTQQQARDLWGFSSLLISQYVDAITLVDNSSSPTTPCVEIKEYARLQTEMLKQLTWHYVITDSDLAAIQFGQKRMISELFEIVNCEITGGRLGILPRGFQEVVESDPTISPARWSADYVSGLTERELIRMHGRLLARA